MFGVMGIVPPRHTQCRQLLRLPRTILSGSSEARVPETSFRVAGGACHGGAISPHPHIQPRIPGIAHARHSVFCLTPSSFVMNDASQFLESSARCFYSEGELPRPTGLALTRLRCLRHSPRHGWCGHCIMRQEKQGGNNRLAQDIGHQWEKGKKVEGRGGFA